jgi:hypothetical protein
MQNMQAIGWNRGLGYVHKVGGGERGPVISKLEEWLTVSCLLVFFRHVVVAQEGLL